MFRRIFFHGIWAGILSATAGIIFQRIHAFATEANFGKLINIGSIAGISLFCCLLAAVGYFCCLKWFGRNAELIFNLVFSVLSFASIIIPISISLPLDIQLPELFPGLAVPMHFFPALAWFTIDPLFRINQQNQKEIRN